MSNGARTLDPAYIDERERELREMLGLTRYWDTSLRVLAALMEFPCHRTAAELISVVWPDPDLEPKWPQRAIEGAIFTGLNRNLLPRYLPMMWVRPEHGTYRLVLRRGA